MTSVYRRLSPVQYIPVCHRLINIGIHFSFLEALPLTTMIPSLAAYT